jgi:hypothetical protein
LFILFRLTCKSGSSTGGGGSGNGCGGQVVPEKLPHSFRLILAGGDRLVNTADVSERKYDMKKLSTI